MASMTMWNLKQTTKGNSFPQYRAEYVAEKAAELGKSVAEIGEAVWQIGQVCEEQLNRGLAASNLAEDVRWVLGVDSVFLDGMLFWSEGSRKSDLFGWFVRKRPHWMLVWGERFGWETERGRVIQALMWDEAHEVYRKIEEELEAARPQRKTDTLGGQRVNELGSRDVAYMAAVAHVMGRRYRARRGFVGMSQMLAFHYSKLEDDARAELAYRATHQPPEQSSKKKTEAMREDWGKAQDFLKSGMEHFFSRGFVEQAVASAAEPDLDVDWEHLPKMPLDEMPIRWMRDHELVQAFMTWADKAVDPASFAYEDKQLILKNVRAQFARVMGQKAED